MFSKCVVFFQSALPHRVLAQYSTVTMCSIVVLEKLQLWFNKLECVISLDACLVILQFIVLQFLKYLNILLLNCASLLVLGFQQFRINIINIFHSNFQFCSFVVLKIFKHVLYKFYVKLRPSPGNVQDFNSLELSLYIQALVQILAIYVQWFLRRKF